MKRLPLVAHTRPEQIVAWYQGEAISLSRFLSDVRYLASCFPPRQHLLNMCTDRYRFTVGLAAAIVSQKISLLPSTHTPEMVRQIQAFAPDVFCLYDTPTCSIALPQLAYSVSPDTPQADVAIPLIDSAQLIAIVFTSGSTGTPLPHQKHWGTLVQSVQAEVERLGLSAHAAPHSVVGTVPPQHMYGLESTVLLALQGGQTLCGAQPFYPADIVAALEAAPAPRVLVSTPVHLRLLLDTELALPEVALILSATAPLSPQLAQAIEARFNAALLEIYGSTETGMIATRRSTHTQTWHLFSQIRLTQQDDHVTAWGGHVSTPIVLNDVIEFTEPDHFLLHGRSADLINIAGKRSSLANLNHQLNAIAGVLDGAFYIPDDAAHDHTMRLAACVVAPTLTAQTLMHALRERIDPVFLPRPLLFVDALPRNGTGKLPRAALKNLIHEQLGSESA